MQSLIRLSVLGAFLALAACNTTAGMGRDLESVGETIDKEATQAK